MTNKRFCMLNAPVNNIGGINTWGENLTKGFAALGVDLPLFHYTTGKKFKCDPENKTVGRDGETLAGYHLSISSQNIHETIDFLNESFDFIIFLHPSPHPTKANLAQEDVLNWMLLYTETTAKKCMVFHDNMWQKTNPWIADIADYVDLVLCDQKKHTQTAQLYPAKCEITWEYFPIDMGMADKYRAKYKKENFGMMAQQFIGWKNHRQIFVQLDKFDLPLKTFNSGIEFFYMRKDGLMQQHFKHNHVHNEEWNKDAIHEHFGFRTYEDLCKEYAKALFAIDASTRGYVNFTCVEPLAFNTISMIEKRVFNDPFNDYLDPDCFWLFDLDNCWEEVNKIQKDIKLLNKMRETGLKFMQKNFEQKEVAKRIINKMLKL